MRACSICQHPERPALTAALTQASLRTVATQYGVSKSALIRHRQRCGAPQAVQVDQGVAHSPAPPRNPLAASHREAQRLYTQLGDSTTPIDVRGALTALCGLLVRLTEARAGR
jgi:DNA-binding MurR/RpiR family transcriptional regulator